MSLVNSSEKSSTVRRRVYLKELDDINEPGEIMTDRSWGALSWLLLYVSKEVTINALEANTPEVLLWKQCITQSCEYLKNSPDATGVIKKAL